MIFVMGDIVRFSDGVYDRVIGFDNGGGAITEKVGQIGYRTVSIIGHIADRYDRTDGVKAVLHVQ
jgi:hypothetical protein